MKNSHSPTGITILGHSVSRDHHMLDYRIYTESWNCVPPFGKRNGRK